MSDPNPQTFEYWWAWVLTNPSPHGGGTKYLLSKDWKLLAKATWNAGQAALRAPCPDCQHPMSVHDNQLDPIPTHCCLVCAEKVRVRLAMEQCNDERFASAHAYLDAERMPPGDLKNRCGWLHDRRQAEKAAAVAAAEEAGKHEGIKNFLCKIGPNLVTTGNWKETIRLSETEARKESATGALARALDQARAESSLREAEGWVLLVQEADATKAEERLAKLKAILEETQ